MATAIQTAVELFRSMPAVTDYVGLRIAAKHLYGAGWTTDQAGIVVYSEGGPISSEGVHEAILEVACYGTSPDEALNVWEALAAACRNVEREIVHVTDEDVLCYFCQPTSEPSLLWDELVLMDVARAGLHLMSSSQAANL